MNPGPFKLALLQLQIAPGQRQRNLDRAIRMILEAGRVGAQIVLLPEALPFGWMDPTARGGADEIPEGDTCQMLRRAAVESGVFVCSGLVERAGERIFNSAVLIDSRGKVLLHHRKIHELEIAHDLYELGDRLVVAETKFGRVGLMICADGFAPGQVISRALGMMGAEFILSPCAWAVPPEHDNAVSPYGQLWVDNYGPVCREFGLWIAGCSNVGPIESGPWAGHRCIGCSLVVDPTGAKHRQGSYGVSAEETIYLEIARTLYRRPGP